MSDNTEEQLGRELAHVKDVLARLIWACTDIWCWEPDYLSGGHDDPIAEAREAAGMPADPQADEPPA